MIACRPQLFLLILATLAAVPVAPAAEAAPKSAAPVTPLAAPQKTAVSSAAIAGATVAAAPATTVGESAAAPTTPPPTDATEAVKPGILSAVKAKGPPPLSKTPPPPVPLSPRFQQIRDRIGALFNTRNAPPPPPDPLANPFRAPGAGPAVLLPAADGTMPEPVVVNDDLARLQQAVATLRVRGTVQRGRLLQLVITSAPGKEGTYKEGDIINVVLPPGDPVHVRVRQISAHSVTLTVNEAEMVLRF